MHRKQNRDVMFEKFANSFKKAREEIKTIHNANSGSTGVSMTKPHKHTHKYSHAQNNWLFVVFVVPIIPPCFFETMFVTLFSK